MDSGLENQIYELRKDVSANLGFVIVLLLMILAVLILMLWRFW